MTVFSKIYSCYYQIVGVVLSYALEQGSITSNEINEIINVYGFKESYFYLYPKLISDDWSLLKQVEEGTYSANIQNNIKVPLSGLQKSFIKSMLQDPKITLFFSEKELLDLKEELKEVEPLFLSEDIYYFDQYKDGDPYESASYQNNFKLILQAIKEVNVLTLLYKNKNNNLRSYDVIPFQIQYSLKDNKFRMDCVVVTQEHVHTCMTMNIAKIQYCRKSEVNIAFELNLEKLKMQQRAEEPIVIEISGERNSLERCMLHFASYQKKTEYNEEKHTYICSIYYDKRDETELLIQILSFGPVIRVLGPKHFLKQVRERVNRQHELFNRNI